MSQPGRILAQLDMVSLRRLPDGRFEPLHPARAWFAALWPEASGSIDLCTRSPFLQHFIDEADGHWASAEARPMKSGPFVEASADGIDYALEAIALTVGGEAVLILEHLGLEYEARHALLQVARENLLTREALEREVVRRTAEIRNREAEIAERLIHAAGFRDEETGAHIRRIGLYAAELAEALGWSPLAVDDIAAAAPMHDLGKIGIPDSILKKPGKLTDDEFSVMQRHTTIGAEILADSNVSMLRMAAQIAQGHHERWDGTGYPEGLAGNAIPMSARIIAIVDVYDALVHARVYKPAIPEPETLSMMRDMVGTHFDPALFEHFMANLPAMRAIRERLPDQAAP